MKRRFEVLVFGLACGLACSFGPVGCAAPQKPYVFSPPLTPREPIETLSVAMTQIGLPPIVTNREQGLAETRWEDTRQRSGHVREFDATLVRRYTATVVKGSFGNEVTLSEQMKRCAIGKFTLLETDVQGECVSMERLPPEHHAELMKLGERLQRAMQVP